MAYVLDANVFIQAKRFHYGFDFCPGFWDWLVRANSRGALHSIEKVEQEFTGADELNAWAAARGASFFLKPDPAMVAALSRVSAWVTSQKYTQAAVTEFLSEADFYLIGHALAHGHTVVTQETPEPHRQNRVKIPDACAALGVKWSTPFQMLRSEQARFELAP
ncbi:MAG: DUF4411 family protein [Thermoplasmatota archaeon]